MSADKYPSIFSRQMEAVVYLKLCPMSSFRSSILNLGLDSRFSTPSATRLNGKEQFYINRLVSRHGRVISRLISCFFPSRPFLVNVLLGVPYVPP